MNNQEKLLILFQVAMDNGCNTVEKFIDASEDNLLELYESSCMLIINFDDEGEDFDNFSINDIVTNHTNDEVSFTAALCKAMFKYYDNDIHDEDYTHWKESLRVSNHYITDSIRFRWCIEETPYRVNFLLHTFNDLLK